MKIAVIDSGINQIVFSDMPIDQYRIYNGEIYKEDAVDYYGHGTAVASVLVDNIACEVVSICPGINKEGIKDKIISIDDMVRAMELAIEKQADIMNISMGTTMFADREKLDRICQKAYQEGIPIFSAQATNGMPSLPWACKSVVRVRSGKGDSRMFRMERDVFLECSVGKQYYRILTRDGKKFLASGSSYAAPFLINKLVKMGWDVVHESIPEYLEMQDDDKTYFTEMLCQKIEITADMDRACPTKREFGRLVVMPFIKEAHSLIRFNAFFCRNEVVAVIDSNKKGLINKDAGEVVDGKNRKIKIYGKIEDVAEEADTLVIGYLDQLQKIDGNFRLERILEDNLKNKGWNVYSFTPIDGRLAERYEQMGIHIYFPKAVDTGYLNELRRFLPYEISVSKPVIGVFGTSSSQGKFTLQLQIRKALAKKGLKEFFLSTEHQAELLGADFVYADGYQNGSIIRLGAEDRIAFLQKVMQYADNCTDCDLILAGNQSRLIPYNIDGNTFIRSAALLEGIRPDYSIVVINPYTDPIAYIQDTISALSAVYKCKTIALAYSNVTHRADAGGRFTRYILDDEDELEIKKKYTDAFHLPCGCIMDEGYLEEIVDDLLLLLS